MNNAKTALVIGGIITACLVAGSMVSQASPPESIQQKIENGTAHISYHEPMSVGTPTEVQLKLERAWKNGVERLQRLGQTNSEADMLSISGFQPFSAYTNSLDTWEIIDSGDIDIKFTNFLPFDEAQSFNRALFSDERKKSLKYGDVFPAVLLSPDQDKAFLFWQRANDNCVYIPLHSQTDEKGTRTWSSGNVIELPWDQ